MYNYEKIKKEAQNKWNSLQQSKISIIYLGTASCARSAGALDVLEAIRNTLDKHHLQAQVIQVGCIGPCYLEPLMDIQMPNRPRISYANVNEAKAKHIIESYLLRDDPQLQYAIWHFGGNDDGFNSNIPNFFEHPMLKHQVRIVLRNCGLIDPGNIDHYLANQGYEGAMEAFQMTPEEIIEIVKQSELRGRSGGGFPTYKKWEICRNSPGKMKYLICNADEGEPGAFMNRALIEGDPHTVLEGMLIAAYAIGASQGYIYIRTEYPLAINRLEKALKQMREYGFLGQNIQNSGFSFDITIDVGAGSYVCGEETALIASIEGQRGMPRSKPPFPAIAGLHNKPTVINNVETLGTLPNILRNGASWYKQYGTAGNYGTKTFSLVGNVRRPGLVEVALGTTLREMIYEIGGGTNKPFKAIQPAGPSGGCLSEKYLDTALDYESMIAAGSVLGSGGLIVLDEDTCMVDLAKHFIRFSVEESCGKCAPGRIGTNQMLNILTRICEGQGKQGDIELLERIGNTVKTASLCGHGQTAPNTVLSTIRQFREVYEEHIRYKRCSAGVCPNLHLSSG